MIHTIDELRQLQAMPLSIKIRLTQNRIREWVNEFGTDGVYVSFSGGKDSTVLLDIVRKLYPTVRGVFVDTGLEFPEIREFVKTYENVEWLKPKMNFKEVIKKYGYPFTSKETAECVEGAKRYLQDLQEKGLVDRPVERERYARTGLRYSYFYDKLCGQGQYAKPNQGGGDSKYRKLRGLGEFAKSTYACKAGRLQSEIGTDDGLADERYKEPCKGEYP